MQVCVDCSTTWQRSRPRGRRCVRSWVSWRTWDFSYQFAERGKDGSQVLLIPARDGSGKQLHLTRMRAPVLAHSLPASEPEPGVCAHEDALPSVVGHGQLLMKVEGVWACQHTANW